MRILKFGADWCSGCLVMRPRWKEIERELPWLRTKYFDYDRDEEMVKKWNVERGRLPVFIFLDKDGREVLRKQGEPSKKELMKAILNLRDKK